MSRPKQTLGSVYTGHYYFDTYMEIAHKLFKKVYIAYIKKKTKAPKVKHEAKSNG